MHRRHWQNSLYIRLHRNIRQYHNHSLQALVDLLQLMLEAASLR